MNFAFPPMPPVAVGVAGSAEYFPVHRVYCVGRNYVEHAKEMGFSGREAPFFFMKPADALVPVPEGQTGQLPYPPLTSAFHHEIELVVAVGKSAKDVSVQDAGAIVWGYAVGLDMTRRDLQTEAKRQGRPWDSAKGFEYSAPIGPIHPIANTGVLETGAIWLDVNGTRRQSSDLSRLIWSVNETLSHLSRVFDLAAGDLVFSGTPEGVAAVSRGDLMRGGINALGELHVQVC